MRATIAFSSAVLFVFQVRAAAAECWTYSSAGGQGFATADAACRQATLDNYGHPDHQTDAVPNDPLHWWCSEIDDDGDVNYFITIETKEPEAYCKTPICGPYSHIPDMPSQGQPGADFSTDQKTAIKNVNRAQHRNQLVSNVFSAYQQSPLNKMIGLWLGTTETCNPLLTNFWDVGKPCYGEVHHVIPVKDTWGCPCGTNSNNNALVVSHRMNGLLNNLPPNQSFINYVNSLCAE